MATWDGLAAACGVEALREFQMNAVEAVLQGSDVVLVVATGGGKTLVAHALALALGGKVVMMSPLVSLIDDQRDDAERRGIATWRADEPTAPGPGLVFCTPEGRRPARPVAVMVDEAHCCAQWGNSFRPAYAALGWMRAEWPGVPIVAATASMPTHVLDAVCDVLQLRAPVVVANPLLRRNLALRVHYAAKGREADDAERLAREGGKSVLYCRTKKQCDESAARLREAGCVARAYYKDRPDAEKAAVLREFRSSPAMVIVATIAFGLGINVPDVRRVVHLGTPGRPMSYYQEAGRAGRDGQAADGVVVTFAADMGGTREAMEVGSLPDRAHHRQAVLDMHAMRAYLRLRTGCRQVHLTRGFVGSSDEPCGACDLCRGAPPPAAQPLPRAILEDVAQLVQFLRRAGRVGEGQLINVLSLVRPYKPELARHRPAGLHTVTERWRSAFVEAFAVGLLRVQCFAIKGITIVVYAVDE
jgi:ATP-dependent DNA helicase RecQ